MTVALVTGGLLIVTASFSVSKNLFYKSRELLQTRLLLQEKLFDFLEKKEVFPADSQGVWKDPPAQWDVRITPLADTNLARVELEVSAPGKSGEGRTLETYAWNKSP